MPLSKNQSHTVITTRQLRYVCPRCQFHSHLSSSTLPPQALRIVDLSEQQRHRSRPRHKHPARFQSFASLSSYHSPHDAFQPSPSTPQHVSLDSNSIHSPKSTARPSLIRQHLRAWSKENQKKAAAEEVETQLNGARRLTALPNSLFVEEPRGQSFDDLDASEDDDGELDHDQYPRADLDEYFSLSQGMQNTLEPGDLIWWSNSHSLLGGPRSQAAVFLGRTWPQSQYFLSDGRWIVQSAKDPISPIIKHFAPPEELVLIKKHVPVKPIEKRHLNTDMNNLVNFHDVIPHADAEPLMRRFVRLLDEMSTFRREHIALLDSAYDRLADDHRFIALSHEQIMIKLLGIPYAENSPAALLTVYDFLSRNNITRLQYRLAKHAIAATALLTPKVLFSHLEKACAWAREYQDLAAAAAMGKDVAAALERHPLSLFIAKARRLILKSRTLRSPTTIGALGPSPNHSMKDNRIVTMDTGETWSDEDKIFLEFLWDCYVRVPAPLRTHHQSIGSLILRAVGAYPNLRLDRRIGSLLLKEVGAIAPWAPEHDHNVSMEMAGGMQSHDLDRLCAESDEVCAKMGLHETSGPGPLRDSMASLRQDLGDMPVYLIDTRETRIRDGGYSLEPNPAIPGTYWIHVHVAHPSAFITPDHIFSQRAREVFVTTSSSTGLTRMFPAGFSQAFNLKANSPALTFSTLLSENGDVRDRRVRPTRLRDVILLETHAVEEALGHSQPEAAYLVLDRTVQSDDHPSTATTVTDEALKKAQKHLDVLRKLEKLLQARINAREREAGEYPKWPVALRKSAHIRAKGLDRTDGDRLFRSYHYRGDPEIEIQSHRWHKAMPMDEFLRDRDLVAMLGDLANESAGHWFRDRNIPACFWGTVCHPDFPVSKLNRMGLRESKEFPNGKWSSAPVPHVARSQSAVLMVTRSLRRFVDVVAHWQADAFLQAEANGLIQPGGDISKIQLPFTREMIDEYMAVDMPRHAVVYHYQTVESQRYWSTQALFRAFHFKEIDLPPVWDLLVRRVVDPTGEEDTGVRGLLRPFDFFAEVTASEEGWEKDVKRLQFLPVKIELVDPSRMRVVCRAVGPPSDTETYNGPLQLGPRPPRHMTET